MVESRGHLNPGAPEVAFDRFALGPELDELVRHVWVARWSVPDGQVLPQRVLTYPACNAVLVPEGASLYGPDRRVTTQRLTGSSWVVGVLFRPAAAVVVTSTPPEALVGGGEDLPGAPHAAVVAAMAADEGRGVLAVILERWLGALAAQVDARGRLVNAACRLAEEQADVTRSSDLADRVGVSTRTLERLVKERTGVTPKWLIECRRLQHAATRLYREPDTDIGTLAADLGYADQAHFTHRFHDVLGETPDQTRRAGAALRQRI